MKTIINAIKRILAGTAGKSPKPCKEVCFNPKTKEYKWS